MTKAQVTEDKAQPAIEGALNIKTFRTNSDIEVFYRFINDNGLRREAHMLMEYAMKKVSKFRKGKKSKTLQ